MSVDARASLIGVGLGPGDPDLITVKGLRAIQRADVVFVTTRRVGHPSYALEIADDLLDRARQEVVTLPFPEGSPNESWRLPCQQIRRCLAGGRRGVFLTEGDPSLYSTFGHVMDTLRALEPSLDLQVIPGVSSVTAAAASAGISLADYGEQLAIVPALHNLDRLEETLRSFDCVVLIKVGSVLAQLIDLLDRLGRLGDALYVRRCGRPDQQIVDDLRSLSADPPGDYFALVIVRTPRGST